MGEPPVVWGGLVVYFHAAVLDLGLGGDGFGSWSRAPEIKITFSRVFSLPLTCIFMLTESSFLLRQK